MRKESAPFVFVPFSKKQKQTLNWWVDESPVKDADGIIADGAIRSGKTVCMSLSFVMWAMANFNGENFGLCGKTILSFRRNVLGPLKKMLKTRGYVFEDHRSDNLLTIRRGLVINDFYIFGGKDESSQDLIQGITLAGVFCDEVALMPESFVNQATARCSVEGSKLWFNCNPEGPHHWFKELWIDRANERRLLHLHFTMDDNLSLSETIKNRYKLQYTGVFYERFIRGLWVIAEGVIYDMWDPKKHLVDVADEDMLDVFYVSCDYGTQNATVFLLWQKGVNGTWYCIDEYYYSGREQGRQKTDAQYVDDLKRFLEGRKPRAVVVDPSAASFIEALRQAGYAVIKADNAVLDGIRETGVLLNNEKILFSTKCTNTAAEFGSYVWDPKAAARGDDAPVKDHDHCMDAVRYFVHTIIIGRRARIGDKRKKGFR